MNSLTDFREKIRLMLGSDAIHYPDAQLDQALRQALHRYSAAFPQMHQTELTLAEGGRVQSLESFIGLQQVLEVRYAGQTRPLPFRLAWLAGLPQLFLGTFTLPVAGDVLRISYTGGHGINGLDGGTVTTLRRDHVEPFTAGAAAYAVRARAAGLLESFGSPLNPPDSLVTWAREAEGQFQYWLEDLQRLDAGVEEFPSGWNWRLDRWDTIAV